MTRSNGEDTRTKLSQLLCGTDALTLLGGLLGARICSCATVACA
jgi:hypothetical protein